MEIIAKHLNRVNLKAKIYSVESLCAFTGEKITEGVKIKELVSDVFTDWEYVKYPSEYASVQVALCVAETLKGKTRNVSLRNFSYYASNSELRLLARDEILDLLLNIPEVPFRIAVTFNNKKHTAYKTIQNTSTDVFVVTTDLFSVEFERQKVFEFLPIIQNWYTVIPEKVSSAAQPTYFTKDEILNGKAQYFKQVVYGLEKYEMENELLQKYRNTHIIKLITHLLNKKIHD